MLKYTANEGVIRSHFFITTSLESIYILSFEKLEVEIMDFGDEFLQDNVVEMKVVRVTDKRENYCISLANTIKSIFDTLLFKYDNKIIYLSIPADSFKHKLIEKFILEDKNDEFHYYEYELNGYVLYFFFNGNKTNPIYTLGTIGDFFRRNYDIDFNIG